MRNWQELLTQYDADAAARYRAEGWWQDRILVDHVEEAAEQAPDRTAVVDARSQITYAELRDRANAVARGLTGLGVVPGDVVSAQLPNWHEAVVLAVACSRLGAVLNTISPIFRERDITTMLRLARPKVLVVPDTFNGFDHAASAVAVASQLEQPTTIVVIGTAPAGTVPWTEMPMADEAAMPARPDPDDVAQLAFTSGTTGEPKGVLHTHNTLLASAASYDTRYEIGPGDVIHMASTVGHQTGILFGITCPILAGAAAVLQESWNAAVFVELVEAHRITLTNGAIPFLTDTLHAANLDQHDMTSLRLFSCIGAGLPPALAEAAANRLPATKLVGGWGMTETGLAVTNLLTDSLETVCTVDGRPVPGAELRVLDETFAHDVPAGTEGHLVVRGPQRHLGFLQPELTSTSFLPGDWYLTGDRGYLTPEGDFVMTSRSKDIIVRGGENIPVAEVENLLLAHPAVAMVAVVAIPDERLGERACACVVLEPGASLDFAAMQDWLREHQLTKQFWPEDLRLLDRLPTTPSGKIQKYVLRDRMRPVVTSTSTVGQSPVRPDRSLVRSAFLPLETGAVLALLTLDRPDQMNPLDHATVLALRDAIAEALDRDDVRAIAFTGAGRAFSAGGDMKKYLALQSDRTAFTQFLADLHGVFDSLGSCRVPTIALVNGIALAGGLELVLACDIAIAAEGARIGDAHLPFGQMGGGGVLSRLPGRIGAHKARELIFSGRLLPGPEAAAWGLVNRVVPDDELLATAVALGNEIAAKSPLAIANVKRVLNRIEVEGLGLDDALGFEREVTIDYCLHSKDAREGLEAFSAKRRPVFQGE